MEKLNFYDVKSKKKFSTSDYKVLVKSGRRFAVAKGPMGNDCYRILGSK
jgi:hypothetical protein